MYASGLKSKIVTPKRCNLVVDLPETDDTWVSLLKRGLQAILYSNTNNWEPRRSLLCLLHAKQVMSTETTTTESSFDLSVHCFYFFIRHFTTIWPRQ